jgi:hypothetical protein
MSNGQANPKEASKGSKGSKGSKAKGSLFNAVA